MKNNISKPILLIVYLVILSACKKTPDKVEPPPVPTQTPTPTPTPIPTPTPTPTPIPTPIPTPTPTPTPEQTIWVPKVGDQVFVTEKFSIDLEDGIVGFPVGKKVSILAINGENFVVSDGKNQVSKPARFFIDSKPATPVSTPRSIPTSNPFNPKLPGLEHELNKQESLLKNYENGIFQINQKIKHENLDSRIEKAKQERLNKGFPPNGGPRSHRNGPIVSLSKDASRIEELISEWNTYMYRIEEYKNKINAIKGEINELKKEIRDIKSNN